MDWGARTTIRGVRPLPSRRTRVGFAVQRMATCVCILYLGASAGRMPPNPGPPSPDLSSGALDPLLVYGAIEAISRFFRFSPTSVLRLPAGMPGRQAGLASGATPRSVCPPASSSGRPGTFGACPGCWLQPLAWVVSISGSTCTGCSRRLAATAAGGGGISSRVRCYDAAPVAPPHP